MSLTLSPQPDETPAIPIGTVAESPAPQQTDEIVLIYNPGAGQHSNPLVQPIFTAPPAPDQWLETVRAYMQVHLGGPITEVASGSHDETTEAARLAAKRGAKMVIAAGGDGTVRAVTDGIADTGCALGIVPRGTMNVLARELGLPLDDLEAALDVCLHGETRPIDIGRIGKNHFLLMCSLGFDALTVTNVDRNLKGVIGSVAYALAGLTTFASYTPFKLTLTVDDGPEQQLEAFMIIVANAASYAGDYRIAPDAEMDDGSFDVYVFKAPEGATVVQKTAFLRQIGAAALGRHQDDPDVQSFLARKITLSAEPTAAVQVDGDAWGETPITVELLHKALPLRVPPRLTPPTRDEAKDIKPDG